MPSTCHDTHKKHKTMTITIPETTGSTHHNARHGALAHNHQQHTKYPNVILLLFDKTCSVFLYDLLLKGLNSIQQEHFHSQPSPQLQEIIHFSKIAPHTSTLTLFFLVLNLDSTLKELVWDIETEQNHPKLERFLIDLKNTLITDFCMNETMSSHMFLNNCWECYILS
jgi:hypothetical protein